MFHPALSVLIDFNPRSREGSDGFTSGALFVVL